MTPWLLVVQADDACTGKKYVFSFPNSATESFFVELVADDQIRRRPGRPKISAIGRLAGRLMI